MRDEILKLLPELNDIHDAKLRDKIIAVWSEAIDKGGWKIPDLTEMPFTLLVRDVRITFIEHVRTVCRMCIMIIIQN